MAKLGLVPIFSYKDPSIPEEVEPNAWVARTAVKVPTLKTKISGREMPAYSVKMRYLAVTGYSRAQVVTLLRSRIAEEAKRIPELQFDEVEPEVDPS